jgi:predicted metal-dependent enzyme (double-stranded beta helix superfamily)
MFSEQMVETDVLAGFIKEVRDVFRSTDSAWTQARQVSNLTSELMSRRGWLEEELANGKRREEFSEMTAVGEQSRQLYVDDEFGYPDRGFRITAAKTDPEQTPSNTNFAHDHGIAWVVYGTYSGVREQITYHWAHDDEGEPQFVQTDRRHQESGSAVAILPGQIHHQHAVGDDSSMRFRVESKNMADIPRTWYDTDEESAVASVLPPGV